MEEVRPQALKMGKPNDYIVLLLFSRIQVFISYTLSYQVWNTFPLKPEQQCHSETRRGSHALKDWCHPPSKEEEQEEDYDDDEEELMRKWAELTSKFLPVSSQHCSVVEDGSAPEETGLWGIF